MRSALLATLLLVSLTGVARADDPARAAASACYSKGLELANQGQYEAALDQFANAYTKSPHFAVLYNIGQAQIALGRPLEAIAALSKYLRDGAEQVPLSRREQVQAQVALLEARLSELTVTTDTPGALIRVDGHEVGTAPLFQPIRLAAGSHTVTARLPNGAEVVRAVVLGEAERQKLDLELAGVTPPAAPAPAPAAAPQAAPAPVVTAPEALVHMDEPPAPRGPAMRRTSYALAGGGVLAGAGALTVYLLTRGQYRDWKAGVARVPNLEAGSPDYYQQIETNNRLAGSLATANHVILGLSIGGGALVAAGTVLFLIDRHERHGTPTLSWNGGVATVGWSATW